MCESAIITCMFTTFVKCPRDSPTACNIATWSKLARYSFFFASRWKYGRTAFNVLKIALLSIKSLCIERKFRSSKPKVIDNYCMNYNCYEIFITDKHHSSTVYFRKFTSRSLNVVLIVDPNHLHAADTNSRYKRIG